MSYIPIDLCVGTTPPAYIGREMDPIEWHRELANPESIVLDCRYSTTQYMLLDSSY